ncbi:MAG TPA: hydantoinase B/oxoprolinase family protein [Candidatus Binatia bacterium]
MELDPITLEVIQNKLREIGSTMEHLLFHSGYSTILRESRDGSAGFCDRDGFAVEAAGTPLHLYPYYMGIRALLDSYSYDDMRPGDCFILTDPYLGGSLHVPDVVIATPVFVDGEVIGFSVSIAHKPDVGGMVPGSSGAGAREIFHEGLLLPPVRYWTRDGVVKEVEAIVKRNCRIPEVIAGDIRAQVGCTTVGAERIRELCAEYGTETIKTAFSELMRLSEERIRRGLAEWPDGEAEAEGWVDDDGVDEDKALRLHVKVIKKGADITFDYSQMNDQVKGPINLRPQSSQVAALLALLTYLDPTIPVNDGIRRPVTFINPEGKITNPRWPAPVNSYYGLSNVLYSTIGKALAEFNPKRAVGSAGLGLGAMAVGHQLNRAGRKAVQYELYVTSQGGTSDHDGSSGSVGFFNFTPNTPIEILETEFPVRVCKHEWMTDSAGAGRYRGGLGNRKEYEVLGDAVLTLRLGHQFKFSGWGVLGGKPPPTVRAYLNPDTDRGRPLRPLETVNLNAGDRFRVEMPGGGGYGDPLLREPEKVLQDVQDGYVSLEAAEHVYGVVIDSRNMTVDDGLTAQLRARLRGRKEKTE